MQFMRFISSNLGSVCKFSIYKWYTNSSLYCWKRNTYLFKLKESVICNNDFRKFETCSSYIGSLDKMSAATYTFYASKVCNFLQTKRNTELFIPSKLLPDHFAKSTIDNFSSKKKVLTLECLILPHFYFRFRANNNTWA